MKLIVGILFFFIGIGLLIGGFMGLMDTRSKQASWTKAEATIVEHKFHESTTGSGSNRGSEPSYNWCRIVEFDADDEKVQAATGDCISSDENNPAKAQAEIGDKIQIQYNPDKPTDIVRQGKGAYTLWIMLLVMGGVFTLVGALSFLSSIFGFLF